MNYEVMSVEEIVNHFATVSRQRISQLVQKYKQREDLDVLERLKEAKKLLKADKYMDKHGCTVNEYEFASKIWKGMHSRCGRLKAYADCTVGFKSLDQFLTWSLDQIGFMVDGYELDKDILHKGNRVYSPETCVFVPQEINSLFIGCVGYGRRGRYPIGVSFNKGSGRYVAQMQDDAGKYIGSYGTPGEAFQAYKEAKESKIRRLAEKYKNQIDPRAYSAMMNWQVEITD